MGGVPLVSGGRTPRPAPEDVEAWVANTEVDMGRPITCGVLAHIMSRESTLDGEQLRLTIRVIGLGSSVTGVILLFPLQGTYIRDDQSLVDSTLTKCGNGLLSSCVG